MTNGFDILLTLQYLNDFVLFLIYYLAMFFLFFLVHDYTLSFIGSLCCSISYYNDISI